MRTVTPIALFSGTANRPLAEAMAAKLGVPLSDAHIERFPDGEVSAEVKESVRDHQVFVIQPTAQPVNDHLMELVALVDACRRAAAERVIAVIPYFGYARADRRKSRRVPIMARVTAEILQTAGVEHVVTLDLHSTQVEGFFRIPVENLTAIAVLAAAVTEVSGPETVVVSPDIGAVERANALAEKLGASVAILPKHRISGSEVEVGKLIGDVTGRPCLILDDMISTGGTILKAVEAVREAGGGPDVRVAATHGVFTEGALGRLVAAGVDQVLVTDSVVARPEEAEVVRRVTIAPLLASAVHRIAHGESLRDLF